MEILISKSFLPAYILLEVSMFDRQEYMREYLKQYRKNNPEKTKEYSRKWKAAHREHDKEYSKQYREKNKTVISARRKKERKDHGESINLKFHNYRESEIRPFLSKKLSNLRGRHHGKASDKYKVSITLDYLVDLWERQQGVCALSGKKMDHKFNSPFGVSIDRIDSKDCYRDGNVQLVCQAINFAKNGFTNEEFLYFWEHKESEHAL